MRRMNVRQGSSSRVIGGCRGTGVPIEIRDEAGELCDLAACFLLAQEAEQRRLSREIHDDLGQKLALLEIQVERMKRAPAADAGMVSDLESLRGNVAALAKDLHRICHCLHPVILDTLGLVAGIESLCEEYTRMSGITVKFLRGNIPPVPSAISLCLYRVVQEALHNVSKHSRAKRATVMLCGNSAGIRVMIRDAGCGFDLSRSRTDCTRTNQGLGLISLSERVRLLGGRYMIRSQPGRGTRIVAFLPFSSAEAGSDFKMG